jgi:tight adherence protein C
MLAPDSIVRKLRNRHMKRIQDELPDALDMMVICAQAGLGLGTTIVRVAQELWTTHRAVAAELAQTANEMQMMTDGKLPLTNFGERCGVDSAKRLATTLVQSAQYGTPLTESLRGLAGELRSELIMRFEARAARMPVLLTLPMITFILPSLFLVIGGPAVIKVMHGFNL